MTPTSVMSVSHLDASTVEQRVEYRVLRPADWTPGETLPLVLHLHGALSSSTSLELARPLYDELWAEGALPRAVVACPSVPTTGGFYIDWPGGPAWETFTARELPEHLAAQYGPFSATGLVGASMGGYAVLKIAFAAPHRFAVVAALSPAVFPGEAPEEVPDRNIPSVLGQLHAAMGGGTGDAASYTANSVHGRARSNAAALRAAQTPLLLDCGAADEYLLHEGAEHLHGVLTALAVPHTFRLVEGAGHLGPAAETRTREAIRFVGEALQHAHATTA